MLFFHLFKLYIIKKCYVNKTIVSFILINLLINISALAQVNMSDGNTDPNQTVCVRATHFFKNTTGQMANDLHFTMFQRDRSDVRVLGGTVMGGEPFTMGTMAITRATEHGAPDDGQNHGYDVDISGANVPAGDTVKFDIALYVNKRNALKVKGNWTFDGDNIGKARIGKGFKVDRPRQGGNGGNAMNPGGGGMGAQQGNGGTGNYYHTTYIDNEDTVAFELVELKLLAADTFYSNIDSIDWEMIDPIADTVTFPLLIPAQGEYKYGFNTTGSYLDSHVYLRYITRPASGNQNLLNEDEEVSYGDHPVDELFITPVEAIPTLSQWGLILLALFILIIGLVGLKNQVNEPQKSN